MSYDATETRTWWLLTFLLYLTMGLCASSRALAQVHTDVVFLIDGSESVEPCLFEFEKEAIATLICGGDCTSCTPAYLPHDGSIAIAVVQFAGDAPDDAVVEVELAPLDTLGTPTPQALCESVESITKYGEGGWTPLLAGLQKVREVFEESTTGATERVLIIVSDVTDLGDFEYEVLMEAEAMRTLCDRPIRISAFRFSDYPQNSHAPFDPPCDIPAADELLLEISNTPDAPEFTPDQPIGVFECRELCPGGNCGTVPDNCTYDPDIDVGAFIDLSRTLICPTGVNDVTITQQTQQDPPNPVSVGSTVTFTVAAETGDGYLYYQWQKSGADMFGETAAALVLTDVQVCDAGAYACRVWTPCDEEVSGGSGGGG